MIVISSKECLHVGLYLVVLYQMQIIFSNIPGWYYCPLQEGVLLEIGFSNNGYGCLSMSVCVYVCPIDIHADM